MRGKGIVVEIAPKNKVVVMTFQGEFLRVKCTKPVCVGEEIYFPYRTRSNTLMYSVVAMIFLALVSAGLYGTQFYIPGGRLAAYYITVDINPSVELTLNKHQRVIKVEGLNDDGKELLRNVKVVGKTFEQAIETIGNRAEMDGYLQVGENEIVVTIARNHELEDPVTATNENLRAETVEMLASTTRTEFYEIDEEIVETINKVYQANVRIVQIPPEIRDLAREAGMSPAHYIATHVMPEEYEAEGSLQVVMEQFQPEQDEVTTISATMEKDGDERKYEFVINRPNFAPPSWSRESVTSDSSRFSLTDRGESGSIFFQTTLRGE
ncbi:MAG: anti-sigma factor domain-containing protein [Firmicutes bacterium]|nr:anti-sigma factor domain-containing protein [Bacillota bacterium]